MYLAQKTISFMSMLANSVILQSGIRVFMLLYFSLNNPFSPDFRLLLLPPPERKEVSFRI